MFGFKNSNDGDDDYDSTGNQGRPTSDPVIDDPATMQPVPSAAPSTSLPTKTPFFEDLLFQPPSESNCIDIAGNKTIACR